MVVAGNHPASRNSSQSRKKPSGVRTKKTERDYESELSPMVESLSDDVRPLAQTLATNCARLSATMDACWADYSKNGAVVTYDNGPVYQAFDRESRSKAF